VSAMSRRTPRLTTVVRFEWNALHVGDHVLAHDPRDVEMALLPGVVVMVQPVPGSNDVGIRVSGDDGQAMVLRPKRLAVHPDPRDTTEDCWRCNEITAAAARPAELTDAGVP
jgi:hypothetical protein